MTEDDDISLQQIADTSGVELRTLRSWLAQDLLLAPLRQGRGAAYPRSNLARALAIRAMREIEGASLADIRRRLWTMTEAEIEAAGEVLKPRPAPENSAADYLRGLSRQSAAEVPGGSAALNLTPPAAAARKGKVRTVTVITITPDVSLHVEGDLPPAARIDFERIADLVRAILKGETPDVR